jgi:hypothetical protein
VACDDNLLGSCQPQIVREIILHFGQRYFTAALLRTRRATLGLQLS